MENLPGPGLGKCYFSIFVDPHPLRSVSERVFADGYNLVPMSTFVIEERIQYKES